MDINLFSDLIDAMGKAGGWLKSTASLPKSERDRYRHVLDDTYQLIHATLTMIILRLGDILRIADEGEFSRRLTGWRTTPSGWRPSANFVSARACAWR